MIRYLVTGGCSFSHRPESWISNLSTHLEKTNPKMESIHTGYPSQGQEMIQKKVILNLMKLIDSGINPKEILAVVMWSGTARKCWYVDNPSIINQMVTGWGRFFGGMTPQFLDLEDKIYGTPSQFESAYKDKFNYNPHGGWYFTVNGSDCPVEFVQQHYLLDQHVPGLGKIHSSLENMIMLQNFCKLHNIPLVQQYFMDSVFEDIENHKDNQLINYLYKQLDINGMIKVGMFEYLHVLMGVKKENIFDVTHQSRLVIDAGRGYFNKDGFHPGDLGKKMWCENILFPFLKEHRCV